MFRHHREMQEVVSELTDKYPDVYVRNLAQKHMEDKQVSQSNERKSLRECVRFQSLEGRWNSTITSAKDRQKQQFKNRVMQLYEESFVTNANKQFVDKIKFEILSFFVVVE